MKVLIIGAGGMVGRKLVGKLSQENLTPNPISELILYDIVNVKNPNSKIPTKILSGDFSKLDQTILLANAKPDLIFHLASIVSGEAEQNFRKGWITNTQGTWQLLEEFRRLNEASNGSYKPKFIFTSSIAVFGKPFPEKIDDTFLCSPLTSYGAQKATIEMLISDYSRKGFIEGISLRLPTICIRPGKPNLAASSFFSGIIREPLNGIEAILPVSEKVRHWHASPRAATNFLMHAAKIELGLLGNRRSINMPGLSCTVEEQIESLRAIAGNSIVSLIKPKPNPNIIEIVGGWPQNFAPKRAKDLGFSCEKTFSEIIKIYLQEDFKK